MGKVFQNSSDSIDLLVISVACHTEVNRAIYRLFVKDQKKIAILLPRTIKIRNLTVPSDSKKIDDPEIIEENLIGSNPRFQLFTNQFKWLRKNKPKVILLDADPISFNAISTGFWCWFNGSRLCCISCENMSIGLIDNYKRKGFPSIFSTILKIVLSFVSKRFVDTVFTINNDGTKIFQAEKYNRVVQMPLGFDPEIFNINQDVRLAKRKVLNVENFLIGFFGRVTKEKGILVLLEALSTLKNLEWQLLMDEFSHYKSDFSYEVQDKINNLGLQERILYVNPTHSEMGEYINAVDAVVMPSFSTKSWVEQYGRVAAESMACGKVVIASNSGALPFLIGDHGILCEERNVNSLAFSIKKLIMDKGLHMGKLNPCEISQYALDQLSIYKQKEIMKKILFPAS